jgi:hypothetical protein
VRGLDGGADDGFMLVRRQGRRLARGFTDHECGNAGGDLALAKVGEGLQVDAA